MKTELLKQIKKGDFINHKHFGVCYVEKVEITIFGVWFGIIIRPLSIEAYIKLASWSGVRFNKTLEHSNRLIISKLEKPTIPKLIFKNNEKFEVHKWKKLGEVSNEGKFSSVKIKTFLNQEEAISFASFE